MSRYVDIEPYEKKGFILAHFNPARGGHKSISPQDATEQAVCFLCLVAILKRSLTGSNA